MSRHGISRLQDVNSSDIIGFVLGIMACSHCTGQRGRTGTGLGAMGSNILYRNVHSGLRREEEPGHIVSYCAGPVPCTSPVPVQCE